MSYVVPAPLIYQQLAGSGGVANVTPDLDALIVGPCYNVLSYVAGSATSLTLTSGLTSSGAAYSLVDNTVNNVVYLPGQKPGQIVDLNSIQVYMNNALVQTLSTKFSASSGSNILNIVDHSGTCAATASSATLASVINATDLAVGDSVTVTGAGTAGAALVSTIVSISGTNVTLADQASTSNASATISKNAISNVNSVSSTLKVEAGDKAVVTYGSTVVISTILSVTNLNGTITQISLADVMPAGVAAQVTLTVNKTYNNLLLGASYNSHTNYDTTATIATNSVTIKPQPAVVYGIVTYGEVHIAYRALRTDLSGAIQTISNVDELKGVLGDLTDANPLGLAVELALANTVGQIKAMAIQSDDLAGYLDALDLAAASRVYALAPLTQDLAIIAAFQQHVEQLSTPEEALWRMALVNTAIPSTQAIGQYNASLVNANSGNNTITLVNGAYVLTASNAQFLSDGVTPGDTVHITAGTGTPSPIGAVTVLNVLSNQQLTLQASGTATAVSYYIDRTLSKSQQAAIVAGNSRTFTSSRVVNVQPDICGVTVSGVVKYLPGYYLCAALAGLVSGLPVQQGLTNIGVAGISDLSHSNFYFTRAQLNTMAAAGTFLMIQESPSSIPYCRHELTTDMSVLEYREVQQVKNFDFLSYFFRDLLAPFIGKWNITPDSLNTLRSTINAGGKLLQGKKLPKIGPPLVDFSITKLEQNANNKDMVDIVVPVTIPTVMNYVNLYLII